MYNQHTEHRLLIRSKAINVSLKLIVSNNNAENISDKIERKCFLNYLRRTNIDALNRPNYVVTMETSVHNFTA